MLTILREHWGSYVSGSEIATRLGISKALVSRVIASLRSRGIPIAVHKRKGYSLIFEDDLAKAREYTSLIEIATPIRYDIKFYGKCDRSSQDIAAEIARDRHDEGIVVLCDSMERGRGRLGRLWYAPSGGLWFTVVLRPKRIPALHLLSFCAGIAVAEAVRDLLDIEVGLKWPNDVVYHGKKLCGILIEAEAEADAIRFVLIGIGINVNNEIPPQLRETAISLCEILGKPVPRTTLLLTILAKLGSLYRDLLEERYRDIVSRWRALSETLGRLVEVHTVEGTVIQGKAVNVDELGRLLVDDGTHIITIEAGDVIHLR